MRTTRDRPHNTRADWCIFVLGLLLLVTGCLPTTDEPDNRDERSTGNDRAPIATAAVQDRGASDTFDVVGVDGQGLPEDVEEADVSDHVDGDTIEIVYPSDDWWYKVRMIGIDAPESVRPNYPVECYGPEASERTAELLPVGATVYLERDVSDEDDFDRLLRHVWIVDSQTGDAYLVSEILVRGGYVDARTYPPDDEYEDRLSDAEREAKRDDAGLWGACES